MSPDLISRGMATQGTEAFCNDSPQSYCKPLRVSPAEAAFSIPPNGKTPRGVAQMARAPVSKTEGRRFESCRPCATNFARHGDADVY